MISFPPCKINLGLAVLAKRSDGYHDLETCFFPIPWTDILEIIPSTSISFSSSGNPIPGDTATNLCLLAYQRLAADYNLPPVTIHLHKVIPMGAGLGGGSSDGAHTLRLLNSLFELHLSTEKLLMYAASLGSDCSFFIHDKAMIGNGRGEILSPTTVSLAGKFIVLAKPPIHVSTAEAYAGVIPAIPTLRVENVLLEHPIAEWKTLLKNDFEASVFKKYPAIESIKNSLYAAGAVYSSMSGSGSTVFGIFDRETILPFPAEYDTWSGYLS